MTGLSLAALTGGRKTFEVPCTIEIEHTAESFHAYVDLDGDIEINPGDEVIVHGEPIRAAYGERLVLRRVATVTRAHWLDRIATKIAANLELTELYEVSFSHRRTL